MPSDLDDTDDFNAAMAANAPVALKRVAGGAITNADGKPALWTDDGAWDESQIQARPWVVPGVAMRGAVTVVAGMGSAGKSTLMVGWAVAAALGQELGSFVPQEPLKVLVYNVEDDADEQRRRLSAALRQFGRTPMDLAGKIVRCGPTGVGTLLERDLGTGQVGVTPAWNLLDQLLAEQRPDLVILDPLVELHTAEENDNTALRLIIAHLRELAQKHRCALILVHHTRKGAVAGDMDAIRGAGSLVGAARCAFTVTPMSEDEANELGITGVSRRSYVRLDSVKGNYAPAKEAAWHELVEYELDNGERIAGITPWKCPVASSGPEPEAMALIAAAVERGTPEGAYSPRLAVEQDRSIAPLLAKHGIVGDGAQKAALKRLLADGFTVQTFVGPQRKPVKGLRAPNGAPNCKWVSTSAQEAGDA